MRYLREQIEEHIWSSRRDCKDRLSDRLWNYRWVSPHTHLYIPIWDSFSDRLMNRLRDRLCIRLWNRLREVVKCNT